MSNHLEATISLVDHMNPGIGYQITITDARNGAALLLTSRHPITGQDLLAYEECIEVLNGYSSMQSLQTIKLANLAMSHGELQFAHLCTAALAGEPWAVERVTGIVAEIAKYDNHEAATLLAIRNADTGRPDGATPRGFAP